MLSFNKGVRPFIVGLPTTIIDVETESILKDLNPTGYILFRRNCESEDQVKSLVEKINQISPNPLIMIDQEGGRVNRIRWFPYMAPAAKTFGDIYHEDHEEGIEAARLSAFVMAAQLHELGITVSCAPCADVLVGNTIDAIGDRAFSHDAHAVGVLSAATISGLMAGGVLPVIKHAPGHGRAVVDSHESLPVVSASLDVLEANDFAPFKMNNQCPMIMSAHIKYDALDEVDCFTQSSKSIDYMRQKLGMNGLLMSDDLAMNALEGDVMLRAERSFDAGCDFMIYGGTSFRTGGWHEDGLDVLKQLASFGTMRADATEKLRNLPQLPQPDVAVVEEAFIKLQGMMNGL